MTTTEMEDFVESQSKGTVDTYKRKFIGGQRKWTRLIR